MKTAKTLFNFYTLIFATTLLLAPQAHSQIVKDTLFSWKGYASRSTCGLQIFKNPTDTVRGYTIVLKELAENPGRSTIDDLAYIAEEIGRSYNIDPAKPLWVIHWGAFSYINGQKKGKDLFIRATFRRTSTGRLSSPQWRIIRREDVEEYTDRQFR